MLLFSLLRLYLFRILLLILLALFSSLATLVLPWGIRRILDDVLMTGHGTSLGPILLVLSAVVIARTTADFTRRYWSNRTGEEIVGALRARIYRHVHRASLPALQEMTPAQIVARMSADVDSVKRFLFGEGLEFLCSVMGGAVVCRVLIGLNARLAWSLLGALPLFAVIYGALFPRLRQACLSWGQAQGKIIACVDEVMRGIATVRAFGGDTREVARLEATQHAGIAAAVRMHALNIALWVLVDFFSAVLVIGALWLGSREVISGRMTVGALVAFYSYLGMLFLPLVRMAAVSGAYQEAAAALVRINGVLQLPLAPVSLPGANVLMPLEGEIRFEGVSFAYAPGRQTLRGVSFLVRPGEVVGLIGPSGAGKSTIVGLLSRLLDPDQGRILFDGHDLRSLDLKAHRQQVAVVLQEDVLFQGTVAENIAYGCPSATRAELIRAARDARADGFIEALPQGYDTVVGERGAGLSCGQRQRIAIARAILRNPAVLVLDEATSAVDAMTENEIQDAVRMRMQGRTVLVIAHRFSTIAGVGKIIVLEDGAVSAAGTHEELLVTSPFYAALYQEQFKSGMCDAGQ